MISPLSKTRKSNSSFCQISSWRSFSKRLSLRDRHVNRLKAGSTGYTRNDVWKERAKIDNDGADHIDLSVHQYQCRKENSEKCLHCSRISISVDCICIVVCMLICVDRRLCRLYVNIYILAQHKERKYLNKYFVSSNYKIYLDIFITLLLCKCNILGLYSPVWN